MYVVAFNDSAEVNFSPFVVPSISLSCFRIDSHNRFESRISSIFTMGRTDEVMFLAENSKKCNSNPRLYVDSLDCTIYASFRTQVQRFPITTVVAKSFSFC